jgi:hypothetical protein
MGDWIFEEKQGAIEMKTTVQLIAEAENLIQKSKDLRNFNDNDLHGKVAKLIEESEEKFYAREEETKKIRSDSRYAQAAERVTDMEDRVWDEAKELMMSEREKEVRRHGKRK